MSLNRRNTEHPNLNAVNVLPTCIYFMPFWLCQYCLSLFNSRPDFNDFSTFWRILKAETYKISQFGLREKNHIFTNQDFIRKQGKSVEKCRGNIEERNLLEKVICTHCLKTGKVCCIMLGTSWSGRINMLLFHVNLPNLIGLAERSLSIFPFLTKTWNAKTKKY